MKRKLFYLLILFIWAFLFASQVVFAQKGPTVTIEGTANCLPGEEIRLITFDDLINYNPVTISSAKIEKNNSFKLSCKTNKILLVQLAIRNMKAEFFIVPNHTYRFSIKVDTALLQMLDPTEYDGFLEIKNLDPDTAELNYKILRFSDYFEDAMSYYAPYLAYWQDMKRYDTITALVKSNFDIRYNPLNFYNSYLYYTYGLIDFMIFNKDPDTLYHKYFDNEYLQYENPAYMTLFTSFYDNYLYGSRYISKNTLTQFINDEPDYLALFNELGKDPYLVNEKIRELVIIMNLKNFYPNTEEFDRLNVLKLLQYIENYSHFPEHRVIARDVINTVKKFENGASMPEVILKRPNGSDFKLNKLKGKWVYIQFFNSYCTECIQDMILLQNFQKKYEDSITFISISIDFDFQKFASFSRQYKIPDLQFYHFNNEYDWLYSLGVNSLPDNILLDPSGNLSIRYAPAPRQDLSLFLLQKFSKEEEDNNPLFHNPKN